MSIKLWCVIVAHQEALCHLGIGKAYTYSPVQPRQIFFFLWRIFKHFKNENATFNYLNLYFSSSIFYKPLAVPDNRRQAESLSLTREVSQSRNPAVSEHLPDEKVQLFSKMRVLQEKKQKMDKLLGELHTLRDQHLNNSSCK